jgi:type II secretion system protein J
MSRRSLKAFTLLELLISLSILAVIAALSYTSFVSVRKIVDIRRRSDETLRSIRLFVEQLDMELSSAIYVRKADETLFRSERSEIDGTDVSSLVFTTISPQNIYDIGMREEVIRVEYEVVRNEDDRGRLVLQKNVYPFILQAENLQEPVGYSISDELTSFLLRFYKDGSWFESWDSEKMDRLPDGVELTFSLGGRLYREYFNVHISET